jgi:hypothetical protein
MTLLSLFISLTLSLTPIVDSSVTTNNDLIKPCTGEITYEMTANSDYEIDNPCPEGDVYCGSAEFPDGTDVVFSGEVIVVTPEVN